MVNGVVDISPIRSGQKITVSIKRIENTSGKPGNHSCNSNIRFAAGEQTMRPIFPSDHVKDAPNFHQRTNQSYGDQTETRR